MKIYFVRHAETIASREGLIQGSSNGVKNRATAEGLVKVEESANELVKLIEGANPRNVYLYSAGQQRCLRTSLALASVLQKNNLISSENIFIENRFCGRSYGKLEGLNEQEAKRPLYLVTHPKKSISYVLANLGFDNAMEIQSKKEYADQVFTAIYELYSKHAEKDDIVIISATSDVYKIMQEDEGIHSMCYFGNEDALCFPEEKKPYKRLKIGTGELKIIEVDQPIYDAENMRLIPVWETLSHQNYVESAAPERI